MPQKPKARTGPRKAKSESGGERTAQKTQRERFIETARAIGVDESGKEFDHAIKRLVPPKRT